MSDYELLHEAMHSQGFTRTIKDAKGVVYHLPPAEYTFEGKATRDGVLKKAKAAAARTKKAAAVFVAKSAGRLFSGLKRVADSDGMEQMREALAGKTITIK